jgi:hypothetical protein
MENFQSDDTLELLIFGFVNRASAALAQLL